MSNKLAWDISQYEKELIKREIFQFKVRELPIEIRPNRGFIQRLKNYGIIKRIKYTDTGIIWRVRNSTSQKPF